MFEEVFVSGIWLYCLVIPSLKRARNSIIWNQNLINSTFEAKEVCGTMQFYI